MKITIITAVKYFNSDTIRCIKSIKNQKIYNIQHIIVYKNSHHNLKFLKKISNKIEAYPETKNNIYAAINIGIRRAKGDIIGLLHNDDILNSNNILHQVEKIFKRYNPDIVYGNIKYMKNNKIFRKWKSKKFFNENCLQYGWMPAHTSMFIKKKIFKMIGFYDEKYKISGDYDFILKCFFEKKIKKYFFNKYINQMKVGGESNKNLINIFKKSLEDYLILSKNKKIILPIFTLIFKNLRKINQFNL